MVSLTESRRGRRAGALRTAAAAAAVGALLGGCGAPAEAPPASSATATGNAPRTAVGFSQFSDIAVPAGARMDVERSLILGARDSWIGRLAMTATGNTTSIYDFYLSEMPKFGWQEITTVRSEVSVLTYTRGDRVATVQILTRTLGGAQIDITVSPRGRPAPASESGSVTTAPLR
jgi:hypothetical protein